MEYLEPVADGDSGRHHQKATGESVATRLADGVDGLPGYDHRHDGGFAGAGGELQGEAQQFGIGRIVSVRKMFEESLAGLAELRGDFDQPDGGLDGLDLAEERDDVGELVMTPMLEKALGIGRDFPIVGVFEAAPLADEIAKLIDRRRGRVVLLLLGG